MTKQTSRQADDAQQLTRQTPDDDDQQCRPEGSVHPRPRGANRPLASLIASRRARRARLTHAGRVRAGP